MGARPLAVAAAAALAVPSVVLADGLGPHSTWYSQHPKPTKPENDVSIIEHRDTHTADITVANFCLGSQSGGSAGNYPDSASAQGVKVSYGKIAYNGQGTIYTQAGQEQVAMRFAAKLGSKRAKGTAKFPGKPCGTIHFKAKLAKRTK